MVPLLAVAKCRLNMSTSALSRGAKALTRYDRPLQQSITIHNCSRLQGSLYSLQSRSAGGALSVSNQTLPSLRWKRSVTASHQFKSDEPTLEPNPKASSIDLRSMEKVVAIENGKVSVNGTEIPNLWLRDNCPCTSCMHVDTKQRLLDTFDIPSSISITWHEKVQDGIRLAWSDGHMSEYTNRFIKRSIASPNLRAHSRLGLAEQLELWDSSIATSPPTIEYLQLAPNKAETVTAGLKSLLSNIRRLGFCYVDGVPADPASTENLLGQIAFIRTTHYGGFYDFTADLASKDTAYTNIALGAHTDNTYFSDPAGLQAFHLLSHTDGSGGASLLVDGFKIAKDLRMQDRDAYEVLSFVNVHAHASGNQGISIQPYRGFPVLQHDVETGSLLQVRWNTSDRARIELPIDEVGKWYDAARKWDALVKKKKNEYWEQLAPGRVLIFDNWRVMHGRSAFTGKRRICGGYINRDDWISKYKILRGGQETVLEHLATD